jgi:hypothetical protein
VASNAAIAEVIEKRSGVSNPTSQQIGEWQDAARAKVAPLYAKALKAYERDAAAGSAHALMQLGDMYLAGEGAAVDARKAFANYTKAAELGDAAALFRVAQMCERGEGVARDEPRAARIYKQFADRGDVAAEVNLARMTEQGLGGLKADRVEAIRLYKLAAQQDMDVVGWGEQARQRLKQLGESW